MILIGKVYTSKLKPLCTDFLHSIKRSTDRTGIKFDKDSLAVEQSNNLTKIVNVCIVCDLDAWPKNTTNKFKFKTCLFGATNVAKHSDTEKYVFKGYGT